MYRYEKAIWHSSDLLFANPKLKKNYGGYVVRHVGDSIIVTHLDKKQELSVARFVYIHSIFEKPIKKSITSSALTDDEKRLHEIKLKMIVQLSDPQYEIRIPSGFDPNLILLEEDTVYKLYLIMGTSKHGVIPFGNDYLFVANTQGTIIDWKQFHSRLIPVYSSGPDGQKVVSSTHSHRKGTAYITATDICTFRLYAELCGMEEFSVYCTTTGKFYTYKLESNSIEVKE